MQAKDKPLAWLQPGQPFPALTEAWATNSEAPGLLCAGLELNAGLLEQAYRRGIFPWFSQGQPVLWWSPDPRMVLRVDDFKISPSMRKTIRRFMRTPACEIRIDSCFAQVIRACASQGRPGQSGTWIVSSMVDAYTDLHARGLAHSVETWIGGELAGGLYCVSIGKAVFGESMFFRHNDASKIALAALVAWCKAHAVPQIDCQQDTPHLASMGARVMPRQDFVQRMQDALDDPAPRWYFEPVYWKHVVT